MVRAHRDGLLARFRGKLLPVEDVAGAASACAIKGVLALAAKGGEMADMFGAFSRKYLCQESWDFIVDVTNYGNMVNNSIHPKRTYLVHCVQVDINEYSRA